MDAEINNKYYYFEPADGADNNTVYEVLFDEEFLGGISIRGSSSSAYRLPPSCLINLSYGRRVRGEYGMMSAQYYHSDNWRKDFSSSASLYYNANDWDNAYSYYARSPAHGGNPYLLQQQSGQAVMSTIGRSPHSSQQHHLQQVQSRTEPLRAASSATHKQLSNKRVTIAVQEAKRGDRQKAEKVEGAEKPKNEEQAVNKGQRWNKILLFLSLCTPMCGNALF